MAESSYMIAPGDTADSFALRRKIALALANQTAKPPQIDHWTQGLAHMADSAYAGHEVGKLQREEKAESAKGNALLAALFNGGQSAAPAPAATPPAAVSMAPTSGKVYENNEPSPLDPPSGNSRDMLARALLAEAGNQGPDGMQAVANVVRNRAASGNFGGDTVEGVLQKPSQFEPFNTDAGRARMAAMDPNSPQFKQALGAIDKAYAGDDPTRGATHFYAPQTQAALGRPAPKWDNGTGVDIKDHRFFGGAGTPPVMAGASPTDVSAQAVRPQPAAATPGVPNRAALIQMLGNRKTAPIAQQIIGQLIQKQFAPDTAQYGVIGEDDFGKKTYGWINPRKQTITPSQPTSGLPNQPLTVTGPDNKPIPIPPGVNPKKFRDDVTGAVADAATGKKTEVQAKSEKFGNKMELAEKNLGGLENEGLSTGAMALERAPFVGSNSGFPVANYLQSEKFLKYKQAKDNFITALLRDESGAAIGTQEFQRYERELFPQPGETPDIIAQKRQARAAAVEAMRKAAGPGYKSPNLPTDAAGGWTDVDGVRIRKKR